MKILSEYQLLMYATEYKSCMNVYCSEKTNIPIDNILMLL
jgi:hypothetical protein